LFNNAAPNVVTVDGHKGLMILKQPFVTYFKSVSTYSVRGTLLVAQSVEALRYKPEGRGFDCPWCQWNFSLT